MKICGIQFAPLLIPLERRVQTLAVLYSFSEYLVGSFIWASIIIGLCFTRFYCLPLLYLAWMVYDRHTSCQGGRQFSWVRKLPNWKHVAGYFPVTLEKTDDLDPSKNYIFGYHPHGIMSVGAFCNFGTDATGFNRLFPGITPRLVTLPINFWLPIHRDMVMGRGFITSSRESIDWVLTHCGTGNAVLIVVGGAVEALDAVPNTLKLTIKSRKGFIKLALRRGASLVPVISFGENDLFSQSPVNEASFTRRFQLKFKKLFSFTIPIFHGRGVFQYTMGFLPYRRRVHSVVGKPIHVDQVSEPSEEQVNQLHEAYMRGLAELFEAHKDQWFQRAGGCGTPFDLELK